MVTLADIQAAQARIRGTVVVTPLVRLKEAQLQAAGVSLPYALSLKDETAQPIGSFKLRGAFNRVAQLSPDALRRGVIAYSSGNHAQAVAFAARQLGTKAVIVMPDTVPAIKREKTLKLGAEVVIVGPSSSERMERAEALAAEHGYAIVPPYEDEGIIAGQGTCALEILDQEPEVDLMIVPVGGGGLISGVAAAAKLSRPSIQIFGAEPELAADAGASFQAKQQVEWDGAEVGRTIADGLRTQCVGGVNLEHILKYVDGFVAVTEQEIVSAMKLAESVGITLEPSGAVALAAAAFHSADLPRVKHVAVILTGGNLDPEVRAKLLA